MAKKPAKVTARKITVTIPVDLLSRLNELVLPRQRSQFIVQAIEDKLAIAEQLAVLDETAGAWRDENHPDLQTEEDIDRWIRNLRNSWSLTAQVKDEHFVA